MGFDEGQIVLNSANGTFSPGEMLSGRLEFDLNKNKTFRGIFVEVRGICKVHWTTSHSRRVNDRTEHYTKIHDSNEEYMNTCIYLIGSKSGEQTLHPGRHVFPFECQIPAHCPSSIEGSEGHIRYTVKVTVDRAFNLDQTKQISFRVVAPVDLNNNPHAKEPMVFQFEQSFCCWCMSAGLAETIVKLPASGFVPRQVIPIEVACSNNSSVEIDTIRFRIKKKLRFEAQHEPDTRYSEDIVAELKKGPIPGNTTRNYIVEMELPDMDVPNLDACRFIHVDYDFKVEVETSGCHQDEDDTHRLFIGTIPIAALQYPPNSNFETANNTQGVTSYPAAPVINQPSFDTAPYPGANPPYPGANPPYPGNNANIGFTTQTPPYPAVSPYPAPSPYPVGPNPPYPAGDAATGSPYPGGNAGTNLPYPGNNGANPPYPTGNPTLVTSQHVNSPAPYPNSGRSSPYPPSSSPYPSSGGSPYPTGGGGLKTGTIGFTGAPKEAMPLLPPGAAPMPPSPYASASAPPSTPDDENKKLAQNIPPYPPQ